MSEFNPFDAAAEPEQARVAEEEPRSRRNVVLAGLLAVTALGAGAFFFLGGGDPAEEDVALPAPRTPGAAAASPVAKPPVATLPAASTLVLGRNPFKALYVEPEKVAQVAGPAGPAVTAAGATGAQPTLQGGAGQAPQGTVQQREAHKPVLHKLVLTRVYGAGKDRTAVFSIDGKQQIAKVGATFGPTAELLLLSLQQGPADHQWTAVLQVGDADPFDVVTGDPAYVQ